MVAHRRPVSQSIRAEQLSYHKFETHLGIMHVGLRGAEFYIEFVTLGEIFVFTLEDLRNMTDGQYDIRVDGNDVIRTGNRGGKFVVDLALTELGFDGVEGVDWEYRGGIG